MGSDDSDARPATRRSISRPIGDERPGSPDPTPSQAARCHRPSSRPTNSMNTPPSTPAADRRPRAFDQLLATVRNCGPHGHLVDVRDSLRSVLGTGPAAGDALPPRRRRGHHRGLPAARVRRPPRPAGHRGPGLRRRAERRRALAQRPEEDHRPRGRVPPGMQRARGRGGLLEPRALQPPRLPADRRRHRQGRRLVHQATARRGDRPARPTTPTWPTA